MTQVSEERADTIIRPLLVAARLWSSGAGVDLTAIARVREAAVLTSHRHYLAHIPAYARLAKESGIAEDTTSDVIRRHLIVAESYFKSYDQAWIDSDLLRLNKWLADMSTENVGALAEHSRNAQEWRIELRRAGVYVTFSSGTTGAPAIVPRDRLTLAALQSSSGVRLPWSLPADGYDCMLLTTPGMGSGIQAGASGLARAARRAHHLAADRPDAALDFLAGAARDNVPLLIYGSPAGLAELAQILDQRVIAAPRGSCVVTGGGWKTGRPSDGLAALPALQAQIAERLELPADRCRDTFPPPS